jgi:hypothetical protein
MFVDIVEIWENERNNLGKDRDIMINYQPPSLLYRQGENMVIVKFNADMINFISRENGNEMRYSDNEIVDVYGRLPDFSKKVTGRVVERYSENKAAVRYMKALKAKEKTTERD